MKNMVRPFYSKGGIEIFHGDCMDLMPSLPDGEFRLVFTSPPYNLGVQGRGNGGFSDQRRNPEAFAARQPGKWGGGRIAAGYGRHGDAMPYEVYVEWQRAFLRESWRLVDECGAVFYNHKPRVQQKVLQTPLVLNPNLPLRQIIIWARAGGVNFNVTNYLPTHEWILLLAKPSFRLKSKGASGVGDVWRVPQERGIDHPAPFPLALPATAIETTNAPSILDPFLGAGTTLLAAKQAGIRGVGIEIEERYCEIAAKRLDEEGCVTATGQPPLFGTEG